MAKFSWLRPIAALVVLGSVTALADAGRFDLPGPKVDVRITRGGKTLPVASVPNLLPGDTIWVHPDLPPTQSVRYLMVVAFLRGTTNPPPDSWFIRIETWDKRVREEGVEVKVPDEAQQAILFLAPVTGGDFTTLKSAVRGRPGIFVRASQDLNEAGFEQQRIEKYLASIKQVPPGDTKALQDHSNLLARTLALKPNDACFKQNVDQQYTCLTQTGSQTLLDDGHGQTIVAALTTGSSSDLIGAASSTALMGGGMYSAYVGAVIDLARLLGGLHTAQYQYIPAIAFPEGEAMNLRLNTPPSFHNPKSVIVIGLPSIQKSVAPPLRTTDVRHVTCLVQPRVAIPVEGAPLVFSTNFAHDLVLHLNKAPLTKEGRHGPQDLPLQPDAYQGGLVLAKPPEPDERRVLPEPAPPAGPPVVLKPDPKMAGTPVDAALTGTVRGFWGFDAFEGPTIPLQDRPGEDWKVLTGEPLIAGREDHLVLSSTGTACLRAITFDGASGREMRAAWKPVDPDAEVVRRADLANRIDVSLPLGQAAPGALELEIHQWGAAKDAPLTVRTYSEPAQLAGLTLHAGDRSALLTGKHLEQVRALKIGDLAFAPAPGGGGEELPMTLPEAAGAPGFKAGDKALGRVTLSDGRVLDLPLTVAPARPRLTLKSRSVPREKDPAAIHLLGKDDLRVDVPVTLVLKSPGTIPRNEEIEVGTVDGSLNTRLTFASGALVLQDSHTLRVTLDAVKTLGGSVFGPVRFRAVEQGMDPGDWIALGTLVRVPSVTSLVCSSEAAKSCELTGSSLFLIDQVGSAVSLDQALVDPVAVPEDFSDTTLAVPHPGVGPLYLTLRDDPGALATLNLPVALETRPGRPAAKAPVAKVME
jgi:hypothetical protein